MNQPYPRRISLIGMPGSGKSTVGVLLAKRIGLAFVDTDLLIQEQEQATLAEIIARSSPFALREIEEQVLLESSLAQARAHYANNIDLAHQLMTVGESDYDKNLPVNELAAYSAIANALFNTDEVITKN